MWRIARILPTLVVLAAGCGPPHLIDTTTLTVKQARALANDRGVTGRSRRVDLPKFVSIAPDVATALAAYPGNLASSM